MFNRRIALAAFAAATLVSGIASAQSVSVGKGGPGASGANALVIAAQTPNRKIRKGECSIRFVTMIVDGQMQNVLLDCNDKRW